MPKRRDTDGFNLAFLDVMACGLGAVILILILVKFNANSAVPSEEVERLQDELSSTEDVNTEREKALSELEKAIAMESATIDDIQARIETLKVQQDATKRAIKDKKAVVADLESAIAAMAPIKKDDPIDVAGTGEETYLMGLSVEGKEIGILVDMSASMMHEELIEVIKLKNANPAKKQAAPKWQRTKRAAKWLLARVPKSARVSMVAFNDTATVLGGRNIHNAKLSASMEKLSKEVDALVPNQGTNLHNALKEIRKAMPNMTHLYIVTDGLPTLANPSRKLSQIRGCKDFKAKIITGECRNKLFTHSISDAGLKRNTQVNVVLLPLEGDPQAPAAYWHWTKASGGLLISPASNWP